MPFEKVALFILLGAVAVIFCAAWAFDLTRRKQWPRPWTENQTGGPGGTTFGHHTPPGRQRQVRLQSAETTEPTPEMARAVPRIEDQEPEDSLPLDPTGPVILGGPTWFQILIGFVTNFFDTLGIGSFATTTTIYRLQRTVPDEKIPGTLNVGHTIPTLAQVFIYISIIEVEIRTLTLLIGASVLGAWFGAGVVTRLPRRGIQIGMGLALLAAAGLILGNLLERYPTGSDALGLEGPLLATGLAGNFVFGALMTIGVGAYAPIMIMVSLLGMNKKSAFPIMMGSCAFLMPIASLRFIRTGMYDARAALGLALGGVPAVLIAAFLVKELPLDMVGWLVVIVAVYTALTMLWAARASRQVPPSKEV